MRDLRLAFGVLLLSACGSSVQPHPPVPPEVRAPAPEADQWPPMLQPPNVWLSGADLPPKTLALTFDDGPGRNTLRIARFLSRRGIPATFFVVCERAQSQQWLLDELTRLGHAVGNHSFAINKATNMHWLLEGAGAPEPVANVAGCDEVLEPRVTDDAYLFRPPFFSYDARLQGLLNADPRTSRYLGAIRARIGGGTNPNDDPSAGHIGDWQCWGGLRPSGRPVAPHPFTARQCAEIYFREIARTGNPFECGAKACDHGVVLMHDRNGEWELSHGGEENDFTAQLVETLVPRLQAQGYHFVRLADVPSIASRLASSGSPNLKPPDWDRVARGPRVHWHRVRVAETFPARPGTVSHSFEVEPTTGQLSWDGTDLAGCAKEIGAVTTPEGAMKLVALGCDGVVRHQSIAPGAAATSSFLDVEGATEATALLTVGVDEEGQLELSFERHGAVQLAGRQPPVRH